MKEATTGKLERAGWKLGTPEEFLGLTHEKAALIEITLANSGATQNVHRDSRPHITRGQR